MELRAVFGIYNYIKNRRGWVKTEEIYNFSKSFGVKKRNFYNYLYIVCKMLPDENNQGFYRVIWTRWTKEGFVLDAEGFLDPKAKFFGFNETVKNVIINAFKNNCLRQ